MFEQNRCVRCLFSVAV